MLYGAEVFDHVTFIVPLTDVRKTQDRSLDHIEERLSDVTGCEIQVVAAVDI